MATETASAPTTSTGASATNSFATYLGGRNGIYLKQVGTKRECIEMITGCEISNRFTIADTMDSAPQFRMREESNFCIRQCCKGMTPFDMEISTNEGACVAKYRRDFHCTNVTNCIPCGYLCNCCAFDCCCGTQVLQILTPDNQLMGTVTEMKGSWCGLATWIVSDATDKPLFYAMVPCCELCKMCCCQDVELQVVRAGQEQEVCTITRKCICDCTNVMTDKDHFDVQFNKAASLSAEDKFFIFSMTVLIKYMHFEQGDN